VRFAILRPALAIGGDVETLKSSDQRKIAKFVRDLYGLNSLKAISERVLQKIHTLIGGNSAVVILNKRTVDAPYILAENVGPEYQKLLPALRHEHPGFKYHRAYAVRAVTLSDLLPLHRWRRTELFNQVYSKLGMQEQIVGVLSFARPDLAGVVVNRSRRTFTERDRSMLNILRFHISEACRTAKMHAAIPSCSLVETLQPLVGGSIVVLNETGAISFCSDLAQDYLETFFATEKPFSGRLPLTVEKWVQREIATLADHEAQCRPPSAHLTSGRAMHRPDRFAFETEEPRAGRPKSSRSKGLETESAACRNWRFRHCGRALHPSQGRVWRPASSSHRLRALLPWRTSPFRY
jgi:hypothetical protein